MRTRKGGVLVNINESKRKEREAEIEARRAIAKREHIERHKKKQAAIKAGIPPEPDPEYPEEEEELPEETFKEQIDRILSNCTLEYIQRGSYGVVFKLTYHGAIPSGFQDVETQKEAKVFVLKVQAIDFGMVVEGDKMLGNLDRETYRPTWKDLTREVTLQKTLFENALKEKIRPPCPPVLDYRKITLAELASLLDKVLPTPEKSTSTVLEAAEESATPKKITFEDGKNIDPSKYDEYEAGVILMEFIPALDIINYDMKHKLDAYKDREIKNKALRAYCTALTLGIDQGDAKHANFLFDENGTITMIDFGQARVVRDKDQSILDELIKDAEDSGNYSDLTTKLEAMHPMLKKWLTLNPYEPAEGVKPDVRLLTRFEPLKPIPIDAEIASQCQSGICEFRPIVERIRKPDPVKILTPEEMRIKELMDRRDMEVERRIEDKKAELKQKAEDELEQKAADEKAKLTKPTRRGFFSGGKRTKGKRSRKRKTRRK